MVNHVNFNQNLSGFYVTFTLDILLDQFDYDLLDHNENDIQEFHNKIIYALQQAVKLAIQFTKPLERNRKRGKAG